MTDQEIIDKCTEFYELGKKHGYNQAKLDIALDKFKKETEWLRK